jgi:hypothetical protein
MKGVRPNKDRNLALPQILLKQNLLVNGNQYGEACALGRVE